MQVYGRFAGIYDELMADIDRDEWARYLLSFVEKENALIADVACGTGEFSVRFAKEGYRVIGSDISEDMLFIAAEKARSWAVNVPFICQDMRELALHRKVDVICAACDGVNYLQNDEDALAFFISAKRALKNGGMLLFDVSSEYKLANILACNTFAEEEADCAYIWHNMYDEESRLVKMELTFFEKIHGKDEYERFSETHIQRAYTQDELSELLQKAGFKDISVYDAFTKDEPRTDSERLQFVAFAGEEE
ncbi:MAG: class I SAM-dependent methyltransferase [Clostridia bacterium]|nr:class I SAM-dependent methyltransferase [Clostridia bacterium]